MSLPVDFTYPAVLALALLVVPILWLRHRRRSALGHSNVRLHSNLRSVPLVGRAPSAFFTLMFVALVAALTMPTIPYSEDIRVMDTRDIIIAVDISGSMDGTIPGDPPPGATIATGPNGQPVPYRRKDAARDATLQFVETRQGDRVGLLVFDDDTYHHWPLTDDLKVVRQKANRLNQFSGGGTNFEGAGRGGQSLGPIQGAINHFVRYGQARTKVLVLISDGESNISPKRFEELATEMEAIGAKIYMLGVGESWLREDNSSTADIRRFVDRMKGRVFAVGSAQQMQQAFAAINELEKSTISTGTAVRHRDVSSWFLIAAAAFMLLFLVSLLITREEA